MKKPQQHRAGAEPHGRPAPPSQGHEPGHRGRTHAYAIVTSCPACGRLQHEDGKGAPRQHQGERRRQFPVEGLVLEEYGPRERLIAKKRNGPEVAQRVQPHQQRPPADGGPQKWKRRAEEGLRRAVAKDPGRLLQGGVQTGESCSHRQQDVRVAQDGQAERRSRQPVDLRQPLHPQRLKPSLQHASGAQHDDDDERADVARHHQWEQREHRPSAAKRKVAAAGEPCQWNGYGNRRRRHDGDQGKGPQQYVKRPLPQQELPRLSSRIRGLHQEVDQRRDHDGPHQGRHDAQVGRRPDQAGPPQHHRDSTLLPLPKRHARTIETSPPCYGRIPASRISRWLPSRSASSSIGTPG